MLPEPVEVQVAIHDDAERREITAAGKRAHEAFHSRADGSEFGESLGKRTLGRCALSGRLLRDATARHRPEQWRACRRFASSARPQVAQLVLMPQSTIPARRPAAYLLPQHP